MTGAPSPDERNGGATSDLTIQRTFGAPAVTVRARAGRSLRVMALRGLLVALAALCGCDEGGRRPTDGRPDRAADLTRSGDAVKPGDAKQRGEAGASADGRSGSDIRPGVDGKAQLDAKPVGDAQKLADGGAGKLLMVDHCDQALNYTIWNNSVDYYASPYTATRAYSTEQARAGTGSYKFSAPANCKHNMLVLKYPFVNFPWGNDYWMGFSVYVPAGYTPPPVFMIYAQWHGSPDNLGVCDDWRNPPLATSDYGATSFAGVYRYQSIKCCLVPTDTCHTYDKMVWVQPLAPRKAGAWNDIVYHVRFSLTSGRLEQWVNGAKVIDYSGPLGYNDVKSPYFTVGTYQGSGGQALTFFFDEFRLGGAGSSYNEVKPR